MWLSIRTVSVASLCVFFKRENESEEGREKHLCACLHFAKMLSGLCSLRVERAELVLPVLQTLCPSPSINVCAYRAKNADKQTQDMNDQDEQKETEVIAIV